MEPHQRDASAEPLERDPIGRAPGVSLARCAIRGPSYWWHFPECLRRAARLRNTPLPVAECIRLSELFRLREIHPVA